MFPNGFQSLRIVFFLFNFDLLFFIFIFFHTFFRFDCLDRFSFSFFLSIRLPFYVFIVYNIVDGGRNTSV